MGSATKTRNKAASAFKRYMERLHKKHRAAETDEDRMSIVDKIATLIKTIGRVLRRPFVNRNPLSGKRGR